MKNKSRNSSIELLKLVAMIIIVSAHVIYSLYNITDNFSPTDYFLDLRLSTGNIQQLIISIILDFGVFGNTLFFSCSAWFLIDDDRTNKKRIFGLMLDVWVISVGVLIITMIAGRFDFSAGMIIRQFIPNLNGNNWYVTCYILFYLFHNNINTIIKSLNQRQHFRVTLVLTLMYICINYVINGKYWGSELIWWMTIYFLISYVKKYMVDFSNNVKLNAIIAILALAGNIAIICLSNYLGLRMSFFYDKLQFWRNECSPFLVAGSIALINVARNCTFHSKAVNYISGLSLFIYLIHENSIFWTYYRPAIWQYIYVTYGYDNILVITLVYSAAVYIFSLLCSIFYQEVVQRFTNPLTDKIYPLVCKGWNAIENKLMKLLH